MINFCDGQSQWWDVAAAIFAECSDTHLGKVKFKHCFRSVNSVAPELARHNFCNKINLNFTDEPPDWIISKIVDDVIVV